MLTLMSKVFITLAILGVIWLWRELLREEKMQQYRREVRVITIAKYGREQNERSRFVS